MAIKIIGGRKNQPRGYHFGTRAYELFQVIYVASGVVEMSVQETVTAAQPGDVLVLPLGSVFELSCRQTGGYRGVFALYTADRPGSLRRELGPAYAGPARTLPSSPALRTVADLIEAEIRDPGRAASGLFEHLCGAFLQLGLRLVAEQALTRDSGDRRAELWVERACQAIEKSIYSPATVESVLGRLGLSYRQLSRHFRQHQGLSPKQYQLDCRLAEARRLLTGTTQPITTIAFELGFSSSQHFANAFRQRCGRSPTAFRRHPGPANRLPS